MFWIYHNKNDITKNISDVVEEESFEESFDEGVEVSYEEDEVEPHMAWDTPQNTDSNDSSEFDDSIELQILFNNIQ